MIANARMYSVTPEVGVLWRRLLAAVIARTTAAIDIVEHPPPALIAELWRRPDKAAVFMCGLPFSLANPSPSLVVAPVPAPSEYDGRPRYWTDLVVRADSSYRTLEDTFGRRLALTTPESQSGYAAPLYALIAHGAAKPLYREVVAPCLTPMGALLAVLEGKADVAPLDSYALALLERHAPHLTRQIRIIARTEPTAIPAVVGSTSAPADLVDAFLEAGTEPATRATMDQLLLARFVRPEPRTYEFLRERFLAMQAFWRRHPLADTVHPVFAAALADAGVRSD